MLRASSVKPCFMKLGEEGDVVDFLSAGSPKALPFAGEDVDSKLLFFFAEGASCRAVLA